MAATSASASFYLYRNPCFSFNSKISCQTHPYILLKPISRRPFSCFSQSKSLDPIISRSTSSRFPSFRASFSSQESALQTNDDETTSSGPGVSDEEAGQEHSSSLKSIMLAYKEAILDGDEKTVSDIEAVISMVDKEKNELAQKVSVFSAEIRSAKDKYIRLQADFDNFRKRSEKERLTTRSDAQGEVIKSLLPMVDNFERAKQQLKLETEQEKKVDASYQGIYKQFVEIMRSLRVAAVPTVGKPFDPSLHEAIAREESQEFKEGIIIQEFRRGFVLEGYLLRPAMVKVSSGPGKRQAAPVVDKSPEKPATAAGVDER